MQSDPSGAERRCPDCGALASLEATWCGQCFRSLAEPGPAPEPAPEPERAAEPGSVAAAVAVERGDPGAERGPRRAATWPCPACDNENELELDACAVCGTTFASLMRRDDASAEVDPKDALSASLLFPGLGHRAVGRALDGLARGVLFTVLAAMAAMVFVAGVHSAGSFGIFALFLGAALGVYLGSAYEAYHLASGGRPIVSSRALLWATVAVVLGSVMMLAVSVVTVARR